MSKLVLIDGNAILHRAYHALPPLTTKRGEPINAVYGLVSMLLRVIVDIKPTHIAIAFDRKEPTFRKELLESYQAQRPEMEPNLSSQFKKAKETVESFGIPIYEKAGFEADDVIGTLAKRATEDQRSKRITNLTSQIVKGQNENLKLKIDEVVIVTGDRDILQLVDDKINVYLPQKGLSEGKLMKPDDVVEKMGVTPNQIVDFKALVGDQSDNYTGVAGIGPKTAIKLLQKYDKLENIYKHIDEIEKGVVTKLKKDKENAFLSQKLAQIVKNIEIDSDFNQMNKWRVDSANVLDLFSEYGFKTLTQRVKDVGKTIVSENQMKLI
ncbi:hypothetical protein A2955_04380 [Candidatus Woesebacteria bacterium RIFCSPLOWO2_01_FULL_37_19]|uniref:5'-3' exonuclease domain-containing protein n=1 Tax=Candidatus Woesebacteria bacterium RIFCSPLOWO2_01_FULL_37_19 TaxID=1802514 RepID=A0A1F8B0M3_9BACT|nr:MAG: hypothetical protein A2955_04380 [Candidatus Woesebacteria bacterium RIFCSPLOWO2_01_FULL_37_19]